jgi:Family of unknown function (DUF6311)
MKKNALLLTSLLIAVVVFLVTYGVTVLLPTHTNWMLTARQDWGMNYLGWDFYRHEPWTFPLGNISRYYYPVGTNVGYTDSIPLMAILFKIFSPILPGNFQYFGIWLLLCDGLAAWYTVRLLMLFRIRPVYILIGVIFVLCNPVLLFRSIHPSLCAHWLLIGSLYLYFLDPGVTPYRKILRHQLVLLVLSAAITPYLFLLEIGMSCALAFRLKLYDRLINNRQVYRYLGISMGSVLLIWILIGLVDFRKSQAMSVPDAYGLYSMNLNSFFNAYGYSAFLPELKRVSYHQFEGYMYLGLGMMLLLIVLLARYLYRLSRRQAPPVRSIRVINGTPFMPLLIVLIFYTLFALTNILTLNDKVLVRVPLPRFLMDLGGVFRASGRAFWLPYYLIILLAVVGIARLKVKPAVRMTLIVSALALQLYDIKSLLSSLRWLPSGVYVPPLDAEWAKLIAPFDGIVFYPPFESHQLVSMDYQDFGYLAGQQRKFINIGYVAREEGGAKKRYEDSLTGLLADGKLLPGRLYVTTAPYLRYFTQVLQSPAVRLHTLDGYYYLYSPGMPLLPDTLGSAADAANRIRLDSVLQAARKRVLFAPASFPDIRTGDQKPIHYYFDRLVKGRNFLVAGGWAFLDSTQNNKGDSIFIALHSRAGAYLAPAQIIPKPELSDWFHRPYLGDGEFGLVAYYDSLPEGDYQLGMMIKDHSGHYIYQQDKNKIIIP